jgi:hypothetical protein
MMGLVAQALAEIAEDVRLRAQSEENPGDV